MASGVTLSGCQTDGINGSWELPAGFCRGCPADSKGWIPAESDGFKPVTCVCDA